MFKKGVIYLLTFSVSYLNIAIALAILTFAYFVQIKKQTWLLAGFNQALVSDKEKLAKIAGRMAFILGFFILFNGFTNYPYEAIIERIAIVTWIITHIIYVNVTLVPRDY